MKWFWILAALVLLGAGVDRLLLYLEWKGWIDYRRTNPGRIQTGQIGPAFLGIQALFHPGARHELEERNAVRTERQAAGGPDDSVGPPPGV
ncbi:MAG TPA: hypothetical protein VEG84_06110 [Thermoanaerobaculia bacterium]|nr:hypothetical protein [Thermoanaerobaculia bacterium]